MDQYNQPDSNIPAVPKIKRAKTVATSETKIQRLEEQIAEQGHELLKLRREIGRLKGSISDIVTTLKSRG